MGLFTQLTALVAIHDGLVELLEVQANMTALLSLHENMDDLLALGVPYTQAEKDKLDDLLNQTQINNEFEQINTHLGNLPEQTEEYTSEEKTKLASLEAPEAEFTTADKDKLDGLPNETEAFSETLKAKLEGLPFDDDLSARLLAIEGRLDALEV